MKIKKIILTLKGFKYETDLEDEQEIEDDLGDDIINSLFTVEQLLERSEDYEIEVEVE